MAILEIDSLTFRYPGATTDALRGVSLAVDEGDIAVLFGPSGCGKSTLLRCVKSAVAPNGVSSGSILFDNSPLSSLSDRDFASQIALVGQDPDAQLVTDKVWHELAFGLESLGEDSGTIRRRVAEISSYFGISDLFHRDVCTLSGGQKQILSLASAAVTHPRLLLLDEPTAQLDPVAANAFMSLVRRMNDDFATTVVIAEHHLDSIPLDRAKLFCMSNGAIAASGGLAEAASKIKRSAPRLLVSLPAAARISLAIGDECASSVAEARSAVCRRAAASEPLPVPPRRTPPPDGKTLLSVKNVSFRYEKNGMDILDGFSLEARAGEWITLFGANGAGKSTALSVLAGAEKAYAGRVERFGRVSMLPQEPRTLFSQTSVRGELLAAAKNDAKKADAAARTCMLEGLDSRHPFDLSGGETERLALALVLLSDPDVLLLDEPTKGLDKASAAKIGAILDKLAAEGRTVITSSHDADFCAAHATRCVLMFDAAIADDEPVAKFFADNAYYTTAAARIAHGKIPDALTTEDVIYALTGIAPEAPDDGAENVPGALSPPSDPPPERAPMIEDKPALPSLLTLLTVLLFVPAALALGFIFLDPKYYYVTSTAIVILGLFPFFYSFEKRRPKARDVVTLAVICAIGVASRAAFIMLPQFKPVLALCVVCGAAFGSEIGFLCGAVSMLVSNIMFSQGPWTPWQMYAMGLVGFIAGIVCRRAVLRRRLPLAFFGAFAAIAVYGGIMNPVSALIWGGEALSAPVILGYYAAGFPLDAVHAAASFIFLFLLSRPTLEKFTRLKTKYNVLSGESR